jgi:hypothetical protein
MVWLGDKMDTNLFPHKKSLSESLLKKTKENIEDLMNNKKRRKELFRDFYNDFFGE